MGLQGEDGFPHQGTINFVNNQVNPTTGSILVRGVFPNPWPKGGHRLLSPGMFVRIRLPIGLPHPALLVIDRAIGSDQGHEVRLRARRREQGPVPPRHDRAAPGRRPARHRAGAQAGRLGRRRRLAAGPAADDGQAGARAHADARAQPERDADPEGRHRTQSQQGRAHGAAPKSSQGKARAAGAKSSQPSRKAIAAGTDHSTERSARP